MAFNAGMAAFWALTLLTLEAGTIFGETLNLPNVPFPPAAPTPENLAAICLHSHARARYLPSFFPRSGASHLHRRGNAINRLESWYGVCCGDLVAGELLCCAQQAWKQALSQFCTEESAIKTVAYECCRAGAARWTCFDSELPNPDYLPTPGYTDLPDEPGFIFHPQDC